jgi:3',5'-nucleoside bisphosphate phosphatase
MTFKADLHCHSTYSDGSQTPTELIELALQKGLQGLSITDHDTVDAYPSAFSIAQQKGLLLIPGIEFSSQFQQRSVHILGYSFDYSNPRLLELCQRHKQRRLERNLQILAKLKEEGFALDPEDLLKSGSSTIGRPHIAQALVKKGYLPDTATAFQKYLGDKKKCYVPGTSPTIEETLDTLHAAQGIAVLAHPHLYHSRTFVRQILTFPFDGLECEYANMTPAENRPWIALANDKQLLITGGSDFHGLMKPSIALGATTVNEALFKRLLQQFHSRHH